MDISYICVKWSKLGWGEVGVVMCCETGWDETGAWWRHQMEHFPRYWPFGESTSAPPGTQSFDIFFDLRLKNDWAKNRDTDDLRRHLSSTHNLQGCFRFCNWLSVTLAAITETTNLVRLISSRCNSFKARAPINWVPDLQMSCRDLTIWQGIRIVASAMTSVGATCPITGFQWTEEDALMSLRVK